MTEACPAPGVLGAVNVDSMPEYYGKEHFLTDKFLGAAVDGCHRRSGTTRFAASAQLGTEWVLHPTRMTLIRSYDSQALTKRNIFKPSIFANMLLRLVLRNKSVTAVINALVPYSKTFSSSHEVFTGGPFGRYQKRSCFVQVLLRCR